MKVLHRIQIFIIFILNLLLPVSIYSAENSKVPEKKAAILFGFGTASIPFSNLYFVTGQLNVFMGKHSHFNIKEGMVHREDSRWRTEIGYRYTILPLATKENNSGYNGIYLGPLISRCTYEQPDKLYHFVSYEIHGVGIESGLLHILKFGLTLGVRFSYQYQFIRTEFLGPMGGVKKVVLSNGNEFAINFDIGWAF